RRPAAARTASSTTRHPRASRPPPRAARATGPSEPGTLPPRLRRARRPPPDPRLQRRSSRSHPTLEIAPGDLRRPVLHAALLERERARLVPPRRDPPLDALARAPVLEVRE